MQMEVEGEFDDDVSESDEVGWKTSSRAGPLPHIELAKRAGAKITRTVFKLKPVHNY